MQKMAKNEIKNIKQKMNKTTIHKRKKCFYLDGVKIHEVLFNCNHRAWRNRQMFMYHTYICMLAGGFHSNGVCLNLLTYIQNISYT